MSSIDPPGSLVTTSITPQESSPNPTSTPQHSPLSPIPTLSSSSTTTTTTTTTTTMTTNPAILATPHHTGKNNSNNNTIPTVTVTSATNNTNLPKVLSVKPTVGIGGKISAPITTTQAISTVNTTSSTKHILSSSNGPTTTMFNALPIFQPTDLINWLKTSYQSNCTPLLCPIQVVTPIHSCVELLLRQVFRSRVLCINDQGIYVLDEINIPSKYTNKKGDLANLDQQTEQAVVTSHFSPETCICADTEEFLIDFDRRLLYILPKPREFDQYQKQQKLKLQQLQSSSPQQHPNHTVIDLTNHDGINNNNNNINNTSNNNNNNNNHHHNNTSNNNTTNSFNQHPQQNTQSSYGYDQYNGPIQYQSPHVSFSSMNPSFYNPNNYSAMSFSPLMDSFATNNPNFPTHNPNFQLGMMGNYRNYINPHNYDNFNNLHDTQNYGQNYPQNYPPNYGQNYNQNYGQNYPQNQSLYLSTDGSEATLGNFQLPLGRLGVGSTMSGNSNYNNSIDNGFNQQHQQQQQFYQQFQHYNPHYPNQPNYSNHINTNINGNSTNNISNRSFPFQPPPLQFPHTPKFPPQGSSTLSISSSSPSSVSLSLNTSFVHNTADNNNNNNNRGKKPLGILTTKTTTTTTTTTTFEPFPEEDNDDNHSINKDNQNYKKKLLSIQVDDGNNDSDDDDDGNAEVDDSSQGTFSLDRPVFNVNMIGDGTTVMNNNQQKKSNKIVNNDNNDSTVELSISSNSLVAPFHLPVIHSEQVYDASGDHIDKVLLKLHANEPNLVKYPKENNNNSNNDVNTSVPTAQTTTTPSFTPITGSQNQVRMLKPSKMQNKGTLYQHNHTKTPLVQPDQAINSLQNQQQNFQQQNFPQQKQHFSPYPYHPHESPLQSARNSLNYSSHGSNFNHPYHYNHYNQYGNNNNHYQQQQNLPIPIFSTQRSGSKSLLSHNQSARASFNPSELHLGSFRPSKISFQSTYQDTPPNAMSLTSSPPLQSQHPVVDDNNNNNDNENNNTNNNNNNNNNKNNSTILYNKHDWESWLIHTNIRTAPTNSTNESGGDKLHVLLSHLGSSIGSMTSGHVCLVCKPLNILLVHQQQQNARLFGKKKTLPNNQLKLFMKHGLAQQYNTHHKQCAELHKFQFFSLTVKKVAKMSRVERVLQAVQASWKRSIDKLQFQSIMRTKQRQERHQRQQRIQQERERQQRDRLRRTTAMRDHRRGFNPTLNQANHAKITGLQTIPDGGSLEGDSEEPSRYDSKFGSHISEYPQVSGSFKYGNVSNFPQHSLKEGQQTPNSITRKSSMLGFFTRSRPDQGESNGSGSDNHKKKIPPTPLINNNNNNTNINNSGQYEQSVSKNSPSDIILGPTIGEISHVDFSPIETNSTTENSSNLRKNIKNNNNNSNNNNKFASNNNETPGRPKGSKILSQGIQPAIITPRTMRDGSNNNNNAKKLPLDEKKIFNMNKRPHISSVFMDDDDDISTKGKPGNGNNNSSISSNHNPHVHFAPHHHQHHYQPQSPQSPHSHHYQPYGYVHQTPTIGSTPMSATTAPPSPFGHNNIHQSFLPYFSSLPPLYSEENSPAATPKATPYPGDANHYFYLNDPSMHIPRHSMLDLNNNNNNNNSSNGINSTHFRSNNDSFSPPFPLRTQPSFSYLPSVGGGFSHGFSSHQHYNPLQTPMLGTGLTTDNNSAILDYNRQRSHFQYQNEPHYHHPLINPLGSSHSNLGQYYDQGSINNNGDDNNKNNNKLMTHGSNAMIVSPHNSNTLTIAENNKANNGNNDGSITTIGDDGDKNDNNNANSDDAGEPYTLIIHTKTQSFEFRIPCLRSTLLILRSLLQLQHYRLVQQTYFAVEQVFHSDKQTSHFVQHHLDHLHDLFTHLNLQKHWSVAETISNQSETAISQNRIKHQILSNQGFLINGRQGMGLGGGQYDLHSLSKAMHQSSYYDTKTSSSTNEDDFGTFDGDDDDQEGKNDGSDDDDSNGRRKQKNKNDSKKKAKKGLFSFDWLNALFNRDILHRTTKLDKVNRFCQDLDMVSQRQKIQQNEQLSKSQHFNVISTVLAQRLYEIREWQLKQLEAQEKIRAKMAKQELKLQQSLMLMHRHQQAVKNGREYLHGLEKLRHQQDMVSRIEKAKNKPKPPILVIQKPIDPKKVQQLVEMEQNNTINNKNGDNSQDISKSKSLSNNKKSQVNQNDGVASARSTISTNNITPPGTLHHTPSKKKLKTPSKKYPVVPHHHHHHHHNHADNNNDNNPTLHTSQKHDKFTTPSKHHPSILDKSYDVSFSTGGERLRAENERRQKVDLYNDRQTRYFLDTKYLSEDSSDTNSLSKFNTSDIYEGCRECAEIEGDNDDDNETNANTQRNIAIGKFGLENCTIDHDNEGINTNEIDSDDELNTAKSPKIALTTAQLTAKLRASIPSLPIYTQVLRFQREQKRYKKLAHAYSYQQQLLAIQSLPPDQRVIFEEQLRQIQLDRLMKSNQERGQNKLTTEQAKSLLVPHKLLLDPTILKSLPTTMQKKLGTILNTNFSTNLKAILDDPDFKQHILTLMFEQYQSHNINQLLHNLTGSYNIYRNTMTAAIVPPPAYQLKVILQNNLVSSSPAIVEAALREHYLGVTMSNPQLTNTSRQLTLQHQSQSSLSIHSPDSDSTQASSQSVHIAETESVLTLQREDTADEVSSDDAPRTIIDILASTEDRVGPQNNADTAKRKSKAKPKKRKKSLVIIEKPTLPSSSDDTSQNQNETRLDAAFGLPPDHTLSMQLKYVTRPKRYVVRFDSYTFSSKQTVRELLQRKKRTTTFLYCPICKGSIAKTSAVVCIYCNSCICRNPTCCTTTSSSLTSSISMFGNTNQPFNINGQHMDPSMIDPAYNTTDKEDIVGKNTHICTTCVHDLKQQYYKVGRGGNTAVIEFIGLEGLPDEAQGQALACDFFMEGNRQIVRTQCHDTNALFGSRLIFSFLHTGQLSFTLRIDNKVIGHSFITLSSLLNCDELKTIVFPIYAPKAIEKPTADRDQVAQSNLYTIPPTGTNDIEMVLTKRRQQRQAQNATPENNNETGTTPNSLLDDDFGYSNSDNIGNDIHRQAGSFGVVQDQRESTFNDQRIFNTMAGQKDFRQQIIARGVLRVSMTVSWHELLFASMYEGWAPVPPQPFETSMLIYDVKRLVEIVSSFQFSSIGQFFTSLLHYKSPSQTILFTIIALSCVLYLPAQAFLPLLLSLIIMKLISTYFFQVSVQHARDNALVNDISSNQGRDLQLFGSKDGTTSLTADTKPTKPNKNSTQTSINKALGVTDDTVSLTSLLITPMVEEEVDKMVDKEDVLTRKIISGPLKNNAPVSSLAGTCFDVHGFMREHGWNQGPVIDDDDDLLVEYEANQLVNPKPVNGNTGTGGIGAGSKSSQGDMTTGSNTNNGVQSREPVLVSDNNGQLGVNFGDGINMVIDDDGRVVFKHTSDDHDKVLSLLQQTNSSNGCGDVSYLNDVISEDDVIRNQRQCKYEQEKYELDWQKREEKNIHLIHDLVDLSPPVITGVKAQGGVKPQFEHTHHYPSQNAKEKSLLASSSRHRTALGALAENSDDEHVNVDDSGDNNDDNSQNWNKQTQEEVEDEGGLLNVYKRVNETLTTIQGVIRTIADISEKIQNIATWTNPLVSTIIVILLVVIAVLFYLVPMRLILCVIIIHQISKKLRFLIKKTHVPDEITNIFQRIQTNRELYANQNSIDNAKLSVGQQNYW